MATLAGAYGGGALAAANELAHGEFGDYALGYGWNILIEPQVTMANRVVGVRSTAYATGGSSAEICYALECGRYSGEIEDCVVELAEWTGSVFSILLTSATGDLGGWGDVTLTWGASKTYAMRLRNTVTGQTMPWIDAAGTDVSAGGGTAVAYPSVAERSTSDSTARFIATTGNDTTGTGTEANPWQTLEKALTEMGGDPSNIKTIYCRGGTYDMPAEDVNGYAYDISSLVGEDGAWNDQRSILSYPGETATFDGQQRASWAGMPDFGIFIGQSHWRIEVDWQYVKQGGVFVSGQTDGVFTGAKHNIIGGQVHDVYSFDGAGNSGLNLGAIRVGGGHFTVIRDFDGRRIWETDAATPPVEEAGTNVNESGVVIFDGAATICKNSYVEDANRWIDYKSTVASGEGYSGDYGTGGLVYRCVGKNIDSGFVEIGISGAETGHCPYGIVGGFNILHSGAGAIFNSLSKTARPVSPFHKHWSVRFTQCTVLCEDIGSRNPRWGMFSDSGNIKLDRNAIFCKVGADTVKWLSGGGDNPPSAPEQALFLDENTDDNIYLYWTGETVEFRLGHNIASGDFATQNISGLAAWQALTASSHGSLTHDDVDANSSAVEVTDFANVWVDESGDDFHLAVGSPFIDGPNFYGALGLPAAVGGGAGGDDVSPAEHMLLLF